MTGQLCVGCPTCVLTGETVGGHYKRGTERCMDCGHTDCTKAAKHQGGGWR